MRDHRNAERAPHRRRPVHEDERKDGDERTERGGSPGDETLSQGRGMCRTDPQLLAHLLLQRALRITHHIRRHASRPRRLDPLQFVQQRQLLPLDLGHQADLVALDRDFVLVDFLLALRRQVAGGAHR